MSSRRFPVLMFVPVLLARLSSQFARLRAYLPGRVRNRNDLGRVTDEWLSEHAREAAKHRGDL